VSQAEKRLQAIRNNPNNVWFDDLVACAEWAGFVQASGAGSHRIYRHPGPPTRMVNFQRKGDGKAKPYQVKQFLEALDAIFPGEVDL
jgi:predicted RNA binding protein YcfA (HicA-like mRNA interferase family)